MLLRVGVRIRELEGVLMGAAVCWRAIAWREEEDGTWLLLLRGGWRLVEGWWFRMTRESRYRHETRRVDEEGRTGVGMPIYLVSLVPLLTLDPR